MKKNCLVLEFHNKKGDVVKELSKCPARPEDVMAAMNFLNVGCDFVVSVQEFEFDENTGKIINDPFKDDCDE